MVNVGSLFGGLLLLSVGVGLGITAMTAARRQGLDGRLKDLYRTYRGDSSSEQVAEGSGPLLVRSLFSGLFEQLVGSLENVNVFGSKYEGKLRALLHRAGVRSPDAPRRLLAVKVLSLAVGVIAGLSAAAAMDLDGLWMGASVVGGAFAGSMFPEKIVERRAKRRSTLIAQRLPDALDLLILFANAGYGMEQAIQRLSRDMRRSSPELAEEFAVTSDELLLLTDRLQALENLAARTGLPAMRTLVSTLSQAQRYGTPLSQALRVLANEQRNARINELEERAARMPVLVTAPMILLILPAVFIVSAAPAFLQAGQVLPSAFPSRPAK